MLHIKYRRGKPVIGWELTDFLKQRIERRDCPDCGVEIEVANSALFFVFNGLIFGGLVMALGWENAQSEWLKITESG
ncbi:MAG: hypothetical protein ACYS21_01425 [Planctomycetota bacterium]|jgi:hypothetical protein